jgi:hypothetical protein
MLRIELRCAGAKGSPAPNAPMALWIGCGGREIGKHLPTDAFTF